MKIQTLTPIMELAVIFSIILCFIDCLAIKKTDETDRLLDLLASSLVTESQRSSQKSLTNENFQLGGSISGLLGVIYLQNNLSERYPFNVNGDFVFPKSYANGSNFSVTVYESPPSQTCQLTNGFGVLEGKDKRDIIVICN